MGKRLVALLALVCILLTGTAVGAEGMTEKVMAALKQKADVSKLLVDDYKKLIGG